MGYTTDFEGHFDLNKKLTTAQLDYLDKFVDTRRMKRDVNKLMELFKGKGGYPGKKVNKNTPEEIYGVDGAYFVGGTGSFGQSDDASVIDHNVPPGQLSYNEQHADFTISWDEKQALIKSGKCQPGLWCQWVVVDDNEGNHRLQWDGNEKFYEYIAWLRYLIAHFFEPWGIKLNGEVEWIGEDSSDRGKIVVKNNEVEIFEGTTHYIKTNE